jgi:hypothetical protein
MVIIGEHQLTTFQKTTGHGTFDRLLVLYSIQNLNIKSAILLKKPHETSTYPLVI